MATIRHHLKCEVCCAITLLRTQLGWLSQHPIRIHCGRCNILIGGTAFQNPREGSYRFEFDNAQVVEEALPVYYVEASGELLTPKPEPYEGDGLAIFPPSFFHAALWAMGVEGFEEFKRRAITFISVVRDWPKVRRVNELWRDGRYEYLAQEVHQYLPKHRFPMTNLYEQLRGVHQINIVFFDSVMDKTRFDGTTHWLEEEVAQLTRDRGTNLSDLANAFGAAGLLDRYEGKLLERMEQFVDRFQYMLPVFGLQFYTDVPADLGEHKGITTASFEDLKPFYLDSYEVTADISRLLVAFNNLKHRGNYDEMAPRRKDIRTLSEWDAKAKGIRISYLDDQETFNRLVSPKLHNQLRNAIGHNSYRYDGASQTLVYYPSGTEDPNDAQTMSLLDFARLCWGAFLSLNDLSELVYRTREIYLQAQGHGPVVTPGAILPRRLRRAQERARKKASKAATKRERREGSETPGG